MAELTNEKIYSIDSFEGMQVRTSRFLKVKGQVDLAQNAQFDEVGSIGKKKGYEQREDDLTSTTSTSTSSSTSTSTSTTTTA